MEASAAENEKEEEKYKRKIEIKRYPEQFAQSIPEILYHNSTIIPKISVENRFRLLDNAAEKKLFGIRRVNDGALPGRNTENTLLEKA